MENRIYCAVSYNDNSEQIIHAISLIIFTDKKDVYICSEQGVDKCVQMCYNKDTEREVDKNDS